MKKQINIYKDLDFIEGNTYKTKMSTGESFKVIEIVYNLKNKLINLKGIYLNSPHLGLCPMSPERLMTEKEEIGIIEICDKCGERI